MSEIVNKWSPKANSAEIQLTDAAATHIKKILAKKPDSFIHFGLKKAGCTGYAYVVEVAQEKKAEDVVLTVADIEIHIETKYLPMLAGTTIDYVREGLNSRFKFINPNEKASCGCGESFSI